MARSMACELGEHKIRVNTISPGYMYTGCVAHSPLAALKSATLLLTRFIGNSMVLE